MSKAMKLLNEYELDVILKSQKTDFNNFYKAELVQLLEHARRLLKEYEKNIKNQGEHISEN